MFKAFFFLISFSNVQLSQYALRSWWRSGLVGGVVIQRFSIYFGKRMAASLQMNAEAESRNSAILFRIRNSDWIRNKLQFFWLQWVPIFASIDRVSLGENKTSNITLALGYQHDSEHNMATSDTNIFSSILPVKIMEELTTPGPKARATLGDILSWGDSRSSWKLWYKYYSGGRWTPLKYPDSKSKSPRLHTSYFSFTPVTAWV